MHNTRIRWCSCSWRLSHVEQEILTFPKQLDSPFVFSVIRVSRSFIFYVLFLCRSLFLLLSFFFWPLCCLYFFFFSRNSYKSITFVPITMEFTHINYIYFWLYTAYSSCKYNEKHNISHCRNISKTSTKNRRKSIPLTHKNMTAHFPCLVQALE